MEKGFYFKKPGSQEEYLYVKADELTDDQKQALANSYVRKFTELPLDVKLIAMNKIRILILESLK